MKRRAPVAGFLVLAIGCGYAVVKSQDTADAQHKADQAQITQLKVQNRVDARLAREAFVTQCENSNDVRAGVTGYIGSALARSKLALAATLASPTATDRQKFSALVNYAGLSNANTELSRRLAQKSCRYPPAPTTRSARPIAGPTGPTPTKGNR